MMMTARLCLCLLLAPACGSQRVAGHLDDLEDCSATDSDTSTTDTTSTSSSSDETSSTTAESTTGTTTTGITSSSATSTADTSTSDTDTTTDTPAPECGNGMLEPVGPEPEECDDGNLVPDDGCSATCARDVRAFVTSETYQADKIGGLSGADTRCANLADDQGWPDGLKYRAWLSDSTTDAIDRYTRGRGRLVMPSGLVLAQSWSALLAGQLENPFEVTETNLTFHGIAWTGTRDDGTRVPGAQHCDDWTTNSFTKSGHYGYTDRPTSEWTFSLEVDNPIDCGSAIPLYCIESL
jgi:cysteine-rich repeat protein